MTYNLQPQILSVTPFQREGGALASVEVQFGPIRISAKLIDSANGPFLSYPSRRTEQSDKWWDLVVVHDRSLRQKAIEAAILRYHEEVGEVTDALDEQLLAI